MFKKIYTYTFLLIGLAFVSQSNAQDIHFSQFYMSPLNLNPAMTGVMNCNTRMIANYRNQWSSSLRGSAYNTYAASYDQKIPVGRSDYFGVGGSFWGDVAGDTRFSTYTGKLSVSYSKKMGGYRKKAHYLVIGADGGFWQRRIGDGQKWPDQHNGDGGFDPSKGSETLDRTSFLFGDINAGLLWFSVLNKRSNFYLGLAMNHLNQANQSFYKNVYDPLYTKLTLHGGGQFQMRPKVSILPGVVFFAQGPHRQFNAGTSLRFHLGRSRLNNQSFQVGLWYRVGTKLEGALHSDALILSSRFNYEHFNLGFSYDVTVSSYREANLSSGAFEFSLGYDICGPENRGVYCPRF